MTVQLLQALIYLGLGGCVGTVFFLSLRNMVRTVQSGAPIYLTVVFGVLRVGVAGVLFWLAAQQGAMPVLMMLLGFLAARQVVMAKARKG